MGRDDGTAVPAADWSAAGCRQLERVGALAGVHSGRHRRRHLLRGRNRGGPTVLTQGDSRHGRRNPALELRSLRVPPASLKPAVGREPPSHMPQRHTRAVTAVRSSCGSSRPRGSRRERAAGPSGVTTITAPFRQLWWAPDVRRSSFSGTRAAGSGANAPQLARPSASASTPTLTSASCSGCSSAPTRRSERCRCQSRVCRRARPQRAGYLRTLPVAVAPPRRQEPRALWTRHRPLQLPAVLSLLLVAALPPLPLPLPLRGWRPRSLRRGPSPRRRACARRSRSRTSACC